MSSASGPLRHPSHGPSAPALPRGTHTTAIKVVACALALLIMALAVLGGVGSFTTVRTVAQPWFGELAWIVPIGMDVGILALLAWDLLMEYFGLPWPVLRWVAWCYIAATVAVNVVAAGGDPTGSVLHAAMPILFITAVEGVRHLIRRWVGLTTGTRTERIPTRRWALAPFSTAMLWRRMALWQITTYREALDLEYRYLLAVSGMAQQYGRFAWRWRAPLTERLALRLLPAQSRLGFPLLLTAAENGDRAKRPHRPDWLEEDLLDAAEQVLTEAHRQGLRLTRAEFGGRLRDRGFAIANERLGELRAIALAHMEANPGHTPT
ncbi:hypothetical protein GCM10009678_66460 [Actinomadura kijaniata]|uniref:DUF2637 domain-containing protein n=1 Tax=Actinomadura namibiensis TaxID=182080 RepID=A0A7W3QRN1_ACTNM|nr:DUF2637 domain-containing protein [Actinomadura namibiensis]MBA8956548.1 hypothetical protein [Actinomadura namibiensis]